MNNFLQKKQTKLILFTLFCLSSFYIYQKTDLLRSFKSQSITIETVYGSANITEPVIIEIINSKAMQRLKKINQYGVIAFVKKDQHYDRFQHSIGVFYLIRKFGGSVEEQVAGLLHDISHTAFSHVADFLSDSLLEKKSYQDKIFSWYVANTDIKAILDKYNLSHLAENGVCDSYKILKNDLPSLCADRLEYNLFGGIVEGWITAEEVRHVVDHIEYQNEDWIFTDKKSARIFADMTIRLSVQNWCSHENAFIGTEAAKLIKRGIALNVIEMDDLHFSHDDKVWNKLISHDDQEMKTIYNRIMNHQSHYSLCDKGQHDTYSKGKYRGVDPLVSINGNLHRLSTIDTSFAEYNKKSYNSVKDGWYIKYC